MNRLTIFYGHVSPIPLTALLHTEARNRERKKKQQTVFDTRRYATKSFGAICFKG